MGGGGGVEKVGMCSEVDEKYGEVGNSRGCLSQGGRTGGDAPFFLLGRRFGWIQYLGEC